MSSETLRFVLFDCWKHQKKIRSLIMDTSYVSVEFFIYNTQRDENDDETEANMYIGNERDFEASDV